MTAKQEKRKERILETASDWFFQEGFYKVSLDELVARLKISKSTIYEYFGSKEGLVEAVVDRLGDLLEARLEELVTAPELSVAERIIAIAERQGEVAKNLRNKFVNELKIHTPRIWNKYRERRNRRVKKYYMKLIEEGQALGLFDSRHDKEFLLQLYLKMSEMVSYTDIMDHLSMTKPQAYKAIIEVFLKGTAKREE